MILRYKNGVEANIGDVVESLRGEAYVLKGFRAPLHAASTGKVYCAPVGSEHQREFFPQVIGAKFENS